MQDGGNSLWTDGVEQGQARGADPFGPFDDLKIQPNLPQRGPAGL